MSPPKELCKALRNGEHTKVDDLIKRYGGFTKVVNGDLLFFIKNAKKNPLLSF